MPKLALISAIVKGIWAIEPKAAAGLMPLVDALFKNDVAFLNSFANTENKAEKLPFALGPEANLFKSFDDAPSGSIAIIPVKGVIMKNDYCGSPGTQTLTRIVQEADAHPNISGMILVMDSPGGSVDGTGVFSEAVGATTKPVVTWVSGMMASAGYWIGSSSDEIIASHGSDLIGSIGTMVGWKDATEYFAKEGIKDIYITADDSKDKNATYQEAIKGNYKPMKTEILNPLNDQFLGAVKSNREGKLNLKNENVLTGKVYVAKDAISNGLIDSIGSFDFAVERVQSLASEKKSNVNYSSNNNQPPMKLKLLAAWTAFIAFCGISVKEGEADVEFDASPENLEKINTALAERETLKADAVTQAASIAALTAEKATLEAEKATLAAEKLTAETSALDFKTKFEAAQAVLDGKASNPEATTTDTVTTSDTKDAIYDANADHNKEAEAMLNQ